MMRVEAVSETEANYRVRRPGAGQRYLYLKAVEERDILDFAHAVKSSILNIDTKIDNEWRPLKERSEKINTRRLLTKKDTSVYWNV